jgi:hypothetical protein
MSLKLKALSLSVFAALAVGAVSVVSAPADTGGVAHSDVDWTHIKAKQYGSLHENTFFSHGLGDGVTCETAEYTASVPTKTVGEITVTPTYANCKTTDGFPATVNMTDCSFVLTFTDDPNQEHHTAHLECPKGVTHAHVSVNPPIVGECHLTIPPQTPTTGGVTYTNIKHPTGTSPHSLTLNITAEGITHTAVETGFGCGGDDGVTNNTTLNGKVIATGFDTGGKQVNITVTTASS